MRGKRYTLLQLLAITIINNIYTNVPTRCEIKSVGNLKFFHKSVGKSVGFIKEGEINGGYIGYIYCGGVMLAFNACDIFKGYRPKILVVFCVVCKYLRGKRRVLCVINIDYSWRGIARKQNSIFGFSLFTGIYAFDNTKRYKAKASQMVVDAACVLGCGSIFGCGKSRL